MRIDEKKLAQYLQEDKILEFNSDKECMEYFNTYDYQNFTTVEEMKQYQGRFGFNIGEKRYHINYEEALDVWEGIKENFTIMVSNIEKLWSAACSGNIEYLKKYYENGGEKNLRYVRGRAHSLIMGAFRNNLYDTVDYLLSVGETLTPLEKDEVSFELRRLETLKKLSM